MKISVVITTFNNVSSLQRVLESFLVQTVLPYEILVADDGSTSETASLVEQFHTQALFHVKHVWQEHKGFRAARIRNEAIKISSGEYIVLLDGDCIVSRHFVFDHLCLAEPGFFVQGKRVFVQQKAAAKFTYKDANSFSALFQYAMNGQITNLHHLLRIPWLPAVKSRRLKSIKSCNMGFYRQDIFAVNGFNEDYVGWGHEDSDLACRFFKYGLQKKVHAARAICFHLWHPLFKGDDRENLQRLKNAIASDEFFVPNGLMKRPPFERT